MNTLSPFPTLAKPRLAAFLAAAALVAACGGEDMTSPEEGATQGPAINLNLGPDDSCDGAPAVSIPHTEIMSITPSGIDHNWRSFTVPGPADTWILIETNSDTPDPHDDDTNITLWSDCVSGSPQGQLGFAEDKPDGDFTSRLKIELAAGTYYVDVADCCGSAPDNFELRIEETTPDPLVRGQILGPDGTSICNTLPDGFMLVRLIAPTPDGRGDPVSGVNVGCPDDMYEMLVPTPVVPTPPPYRTRVQLSASDLGTLPWRNMFDNPPLGVGVVINDLMIENGLPLGGTASVDGIPVEGMGLTLLYDQATRFAAAFGNTGVAGTWVEFFGRSPLPLQEDIRYVARFRGTVGFRFCELLGTRLLSGGLPAGSFLFPDEVSSIDCTLESSPSNAFAHDDTRLLVTPGPGDIGLLGDRDGPFGVGWGVQFPAMGQPTPSVNVSSHLFQGGLIVALENPDVILSGVEVGSFGLECGTDCRDFGLDGSVRTERKKVRWQYTDGPSGEGVGLKVIQESYDGVPPNDYVLFRFKFEKQGPPLTLWAGAFMDWDINGSENMGYTALGGKLMIQTPDDGSGPYMGTLLMGDFTASGNYFFPNRRVSLSEQVQGMTGALMQPIISGMGDIRYLHGAGPVTLKAKADLWMAIVAGATEAELLANAAAAEADIAGRR